MTGQRQPREAPVNVVVRWVVHGPLLRRLLDRRVCELRFFAARSGRSVVLPVMYAEGADQIVVMVGHAQSKRWWRSFVRPHPVQVWLCGQPRAGIGHVVRPGSAERAAAEKIYARQYPRISAASDPFVVVSLARLRP